MTRRFIVFPFLLVFALPLFAQESALTVQQIMQDPDTWIGSSPRSASWSEDGATLYFFWNPQGQFPSDSLYKITQDNREPVKVAPAERRAVRASFNAWAHGTHTYTADFSKKVFQSGGDLYLYDRASNSVQGLTRTQSREASPRFTPDGGGVIFTESNNLFKLDLATGMTTQLTDLRSGDERRERKPDDQDAFLEEQQELLFEIVRQRNEQREQRDAARERDAAARDNPPTFYFGKKQLQQLRIDPTERYVTFALSQNPTPKRTIVQNYVTDSGYAEDLNARAKVGAPGTTSELYIQDLERDTTYQIDLYQVPGAYDVPEFLREQGVEVDSTKKRRTLYAFGPYWSGDGRYAVVEVRARDNKDRWLMRLHPESAELTLLDRQHDEAWIAGPGISWFGGPSTGGWLADNRRFYFQSERTGYSHLYTVDVESGDLQQLTDGDFEVFGPQLSQDGRTWYFTSSEGSPHERHFYRMNTDGGQRTRLTSMPGNNGVALSPDASMMAILHSYSTRPNDLFLQVPEGEPERLTHSTLEGWEAYNWRDPDIVHVPASDGAEVPARIYVPESPNGAAVLFVHGAGYLQNVHKWWSGYFREYMFHNLLADKGYTVLDVDFRASAGYGRDWRTDIYRFMGGRDLQDYVDASRYVGEEHGIPPERVFIYGGSYGGFITLMALFTEAEHFGAGAALRSVTDWAHYNHTYTANILNTPAEDSLAFARSSPIYHAEGLEDPLVILHGMVDTNVQYQDVVRLAQRLIELGKEDWEMAVYPIEGHGFTEPASWTDEYRRILKLIEETVGPNGSKADTPPLR